MTTAWSAIAKPVRGATTDGIMVDGTRDGAYAPMRGDGFYASDGDWTPVVMDIDAWAAIGKPSETGVFLADGSHLANGSVPSTDSIWVIIIV